MTHPQRDPRAVVLDEFQDRLGQGLASSPEIQAVSDELLAAIDTADTRPDTTIDRAARWASELADAEHTLARALAGHSDLAVDPGSSLAEQISAALDRTYSDGYSDGRAAQRGGGQC